MNLSKPWERVEGREPGKLQSMESQWVGPDLATEQQPAVWIYPFNFLRGLNNPTKSDFLHQAFRHLFWFSSSPSATPSRSLLLSPLQLLTGSQGSTFFQSFNLLSPPQGTRLAYLLYIHSIFWWFTPNEVRLLPRLHLWIVSSGSVSHMDVPWSSQTYNIQNRATDFCLAPPPLSKEELHSSKFSGQKPWSSSLLLLWTITCSVSKCFWHSLQRISRMQSLRITSATINVVQATVISLLVLTASSQWFSTLHHCHQVL